MWPFKNKIQGQPVYINLGERPVEERVERARTRFANLTAKLERLKQRKLTSLIKQEIANTEVAIQGWSDALELAELELSHKQRGDQS